LNEVRRRIENDRLAFAALRKLDRLGLDRDDVVRLSFRFCGATAKEARAEVRKHKRFRNDARDVADELDRLADRVEAIDRQLKENIPVDIRVPYDVAPILRTQADVYRRGVSGFYGPYLNDIRIGGKDGGKANVTAGRDRYLLDLIYRVMAGKKPERVSKRKKTKPERKGKHPTREHWALVAPLVATITGDKRPLTLIIDSLRKKFDRFASKGSEKDRRRLEVDKRAIEFSVREDLRKRRRRAHAAKRKDTSRLKQL